MCYNFIITTQMVNTKLTTTITGILALVFMISFVSAFSVDVVSPINNFNSTQSSIDFKFNVSGINQEDVTSCTLFYNNYFKENTSLISTSTTNTIKVTGLEDKDYEWYVSCKDNSNTTIESEKYSLKINTPTPVIPTDTTCKLGLGQEEDNSNTLLIDRLSISNFGKGKSEEWQPLDNIEIEARVRANNTDVEDVIIRVFIYKDGLDVTGDFDFEEDEIDLGDIDSGKRETAVFIINELSADISSGDYELRFTAYSEENDSICTSVDPSKKILNEQTYHKIRVKFDYNNAIFIKSNELPFNIEANPGDLFRVEFDVHNIGKDDEGNYLVRIFNKDLQIDSFQNFRRLNIGKKQRVSFDIRVPTNALEGTYKINVITYFDYNKGDTLEFSSYKKNSINDLDEDFSFNIEVLEKPSIPEVEGTYSEARVGEELLITLQITNTGASTDYRISPRNYESWAELVSISQDDLSINKEETKTIQIILEPKKSGTQILNIELLDMNKNILYSRNINAISVQEKTGFLTGAFAGLGDLGSIAVYLVAGIILLLIIIVIVLIIKLSSRPRAQEF